MLRTFKDWQSVSVAELSKVPARGVKGCWFESRWRHTRISIFNFRLLRVPHSSAKPIQMKSSMTFIQSDRYLEKYIILKRRVVYINACVLAIFKAWIRFHFPPILYKSFFVATILAYGTHLSLEHFSHHRHLAVKYYGVPAGKICTDPKTVSLTVI